MCLNHLSLCVLMNDGWIIILLDSEVDKPSKILIKTSSVVEYIESVTQNIEAPIL